MQIFLLDLTSAPAARDALIAAASELSGNDEPREALATFFSLDSAASELAVGNPFDLAILSCDNANQLLVAYSTLAATGKLPPTLILSDCDSVDAAVGLLKAGAEDYIVRDAEGLWRDRLPGEAAAIASRSRALHLRARVDDDLRESESRLAQIVEGSSVAMFVIDHRHQVTHWNRACEALTGIATSEVVGTNTQWRAFYPKARPCTARL